MDSRNSSQIVNYGHESNREWLSMQHSGLSDDFIPPLTANFLLPPKRRAEVDKLITQLSCKSDQRDEILTELINKVLKWVTPISCEDYLWYLTFTVAVLLLNDLPMSIYTLQGHLLTKCFSTEINLWDANPAKIDYFSSGVYDLMDNHKNVLFVTNQIENRSSLSYYMSVCLLWKSLYRCISEEKTVFRLYPPSNLIQITTKIDAKELDKDFEIILEFLVLLSKIASLIFHRKHRQPHYECYKEFFEFDENLIKTLAKFLEKTMNKADSMWRRDSENFNYLTMIEYLQVDISEFDTLLTAYRQ